MKKTRIKNTLPVTVTRDEAELLVNEIALSENRRRFLSTECDAKILAIRESYAPALEQCAAEIKSKSALVQVWAEANRDSFMKPKHVEFYGGKVGYRTGTPKLKTLSGWTLARCLEKLLSLPWGRAFVRVKEEIDKETIIAQFSAGLIQSAELKEIGVQIDQDEAFYIEPDLTAIKDRITQEAA